jgi:hypothetical protein
MRGMPGTSATSTRFTLRLPNDLLAALRERAAGGSVALLIIAALRAECNQVTAKDAKTCDTSQS